jgi:Fe(3+) dicitrate transport protein
MSAVRLLTFVLCSLLINPVSADEPDSFERLRVVGSADRLQSIAGSAHYIGSDELARFNHADVNRVLRQVPGLYLVEEEGFGHRPNIGMRGSGTDRSARITLLEDGVLVAPAPYSAPAAYYFPTMARMSGVEVRKGTAGIRHGPYTTGGALNLMSTPIPYETGGEVRAYTGSFSTMDVHALMGGTNGDFGWLFETVQQQSNGFKELDGGGDTGFSLQDYQLKLAWSPQGRIDQDFELRLGAVEHDADETYLGLTADDFASNPYRRYAGSQLDNIDTRHRQVQLRHHLRTDGPFDFTTVVYRNNFARAWYKLQSVGGAGISAVLADPVTFATELAWLRGEADSGDGALVIRNNDREYYSQGIQHIAAYSGQAGAVAHDVEFGLRIHRDEEDRFQQEDGYRMQNGQLVLTDPGAPGSQANRVSRSRVTALFLQDEMSFGNWVLTPGVRYERIRGERLDYDTAIPDRGRPGGPVQVRREDHSVFIPGVGLSHRLSGGLTAFGAVHRGFTPPSPGSATEPERSTNYEAGFRYREDAFRAEVVGFYNDYSNLVGTCTASTGGGCNIGDQFDGGSVHMHGLEVMLGHELRPGQGTLRVPVQFSYTWTEAEFQTAFNSAFGEWGNVQMGDSLPYLPEHQWRFGVGMDGDDWGVHLSAAWVDEMRIRAGQGAIPAQEQTDAYLVVDLAGNWRIAPRVTLFGKVENLTDRAYIVAWRPAGARPGRPRMFSAGFRVAF